MITFVFPGQGSQRKGMGRTLFTSFPKETQAADEVLGYSIQELCVEDPQRALARTQYTQPALYVVGALAYLQRRERGAPDFLAGHSLGEYVALFAGGAFDFVTGLRIVKRRAELMGEANGGAMAAVVGLDEEGVRAVLADQGLDGIDVANLNTPRQIVIAGPPEDIRGAAKAFEAASAKYVPLNVSAAFHSRQMQNAKERFAEFLSGFELRDPRIPVIANTTARPYQPGSVRQNLSEQLRSSVRWCESIRWLIARGATNIEEIGEGNVLTRMITQIKSEAEPLRIAAESPPPPPRVVADPPPTPRVVAPPRVHAHAPAPVPIPAPVHIPAHAHAVARVHTPAEPISQVRHVAEVTGAGSLAAARLGSEEFRREYGVRYAYYSGSMYRAIASEDLVVRMARARLLSFFGTAGLPPEKVDRAIGGIRGRLRDGQTFGMNLLSTSSERENVELFLRRGIDVIEASAYLQISAPLVKYRLKGLSRRADGSIEIRNRIIAKISRPEVAEGFLSPAPDRLLKKLLAAGEITADEAALAAHVPMADDLCVEADSGGHTDQGVALVQVPTIVRLRDAMAKKHGYRARVRVGAAGGIGTPEAAAAVIVLGADFIVTGSINQCTAEAGHSDAVKDLLEKMHIQDTDHAPAGDMFEMGSRVQVLKKGVFFPARANRLYDLYRQHRSLDDIDPDTKRQLQDKYFKRSFEEVFQEVRRYKSAEDIRRAEQDPKYRMALVFKWYFAYTNRLAFAGDRDHQIDFQVHCGPALGAFNAWVAGTELASWRERHVDDIAERVMSGAAALLSERLRALWSDETPSRAVA